jgi:uncharacterized membrane protein YfhO
MPLLRLLPLVRPYGVFDYFHHKIGSTHVVHHLFSEMPFYRWGDYMLCVGVWVWGLHLFIKLCAVVELLWVCGCGGYIYSSNCAPW